MPMKWTVACLLATTTIATAAPEVLPLKPWPAKRKPALEAYSVESLAKFVEAVIADKAGDLGKAEHIYRRLLDEGHPSTAYNLADLKRRLEHYPYAIDFYKKYLALAPDAPDRKDVENIIRLIETRPPVAVIDGEDLDAVILIDGKLVGPSPYVWMATLGRHAADRIGPKSYARRTFSVFAARTEQIHLKYEEADGNVVLAAGPTMHLAGTWEDNGVSYLLPGRITLPPGRYETYVKSDKHACNPISFEVPKGDDITYVYIDVQPRTVKEYCTPLTAKQQTIKVPK